MTRRFSKKNNLFKKTALILVAVLLFTTTVSGFLSLADSDEEDPTGVFEDSTQPTGEPPGEPESELSPEPSAEPPPESEGEEPDAQLDGAELELADFEGDNNNESLYFMQGGVEEITLFGENTIMQSQGGSISGFLWDDGDDTLPTDWNGFQDAGEQPVAGFTVYLYNASDVEGYIALPAKGKIEANMPQPIAATITEYNGTYIFNDLGPGRYVVGLATGMAGDTEYLLPLVKTGQSVFKINWTTVPIMAFSDFLTITGTQAITGINAGLRLSRGDQTTGNLNKIWEAKEKSSISLDGRTWWVFRRETIGGDNYVLLVRQKEIAYAATYGTSANNNDYNNSQLRRDINSHYGNPDPNVYPTIKSIAVVPILGSHLAANINGRSEPTSELAGTQTQDIMFALSYYDAWEFNGKKDSPVDPIFHTIINPPEPNAPLRNHIYLRTSSTGGNVWGVDTSSITSTNPNGDRIRGNYSPLSSNASQVVAVWVCTTVRKQVTVNYVDENGQPIGSPSSTAYPVQFGESFSINMGNVPAINGYDFTTQWRAGSDPTLLDLPVSIKSVRNDADVYLVYKETQRYFVYDGPYPGGTYVGSYNWLEEAVDRCETGSQWTIVATEDDDDMTDSVSTAVLIPAGKNITLTSLGNVPYTIKQPMSGTRHFRVLGTLTVKNIILDGAETGGGLLIDNSTSPYYVSGTLFIEPGAAIQNCLTEHGNGGGLYVNGGAVTMNGGAIKNNRAETDLYDYKCNGGGVFMNSGIFIMNNGEISNNHALATGEMGHASGGGVYISFGGYPGIFKMFGGTISGNTASHTGGGISANYIGSNGILIVDGGYINGNEAFVSGGGVSVGAFSELLFIKGQINENKAVLGCGVSINNNSSLKMKGGEICNNKSTAPNIRAYGGGVEVGFQCTFTMEAGIISSNEASEGGGVELNTGGTFIMKAGHISGNKASRYGGGVEVSSESSFIMEAGTINGNEAPDGGGVAIRNNSSVTMKGGDIRDNKTTSAGTQSGGGVWIVSGSVFTMEAGRISGNQANYGGGVYVDGNSNGFNMGTVDNSAPAPEIISNKALVDGGGIWTAAYSKLQIASNAVFGILGTASANTASPAPDLWTAQADYTASFQTRYTAPVGIYSPWGQSYSTSAGHPVNNYDINVISHTVTVKYVDDQTPAGQLDSDPPNQVYSKTYRVGDGASFKLDGVGDRFIPEIEDYIFIDWGINSPATLQGNTTVVMPSVTATTDIYLIYLLIPKTTLTVSNQVEGHYALRDKSWEFTVYFLDDQDVPMAMGTEFDFTITNNGSGSSSQTGTLTLGSGGSNTFYLKHDQQIVFDDVPLAAKIRIVEKTADYYDTSYIDSADPTATPVADYDTGGSGNQIPAMLLMSENRSFAFTNTMQDITDSGLDMSAMNILGLSLFAGSAGLTYLVPAHMVRKMRRNSKWDQMICSHQEYQAFMSSEDLV